MLHKHAAGAFRRRHHASTERGVDQSVVYVSNTADLSCQVKSRLLKLAQVVVCEEWSYITQISHPPKCSNLQHTRSNPVFTFISFTSTAGQSSIRSSTTTKAQALYIPQNTSTQHAFFHHSNGLARSGLNRVGPTSPHRVSWSDPDHQEASQQHLPSSRGLQRSQQADERYRHFRWQDVSFRPWWLVLQQWSIDLTLISLVSCTGQDEGGDSDAVFEVQEGGTLKNVIIGPNQIEGIHCMGACTIENVWWESVCEGMFAVSALPPSADTFRCTHHQASFRHLPRHRRWCKGRRRQSPSAQRRRNTGCLQLLRQRLRQALPFLR